MGFGVVKGFAADLGVQAMPGILWKGLPQKSKQVQPGLDQKKPAIRWRAWVYGRIYSGN
jgi:hypothetical protein